MPDLATLLAFLAVYACYAWPAPLLGGLAWLAAARSSVPFRVSVTVLTTLVACVGIWLNLDSNLVCRSPRPPHAREAYGLSSRLCGDLSSGHPLATSARNAVRVWNPRLRRLVVIRVVGTLHPDGLRRGPVLRSVYVEGTVLEAEHEVIPALEHEGDGIGFSVAVLEHRDRADAASVARIDVTTRAGGHDPTSTLTWRVALGTDP